MKKSEIKKKVVSILLRLYDEKGVEECSIPKMDLFDDLGMDSIQFITLVVELESAFEITIPDNFLKMEKFKNADIITNIIFEVINSKDDC